ncbi:MAG: hypothetical protein AB7O50_05125 [Pseudolabrys sp.]
MRHWPWITLFIAAGLALSSPGQSLIYGAFFTGEQLSRNIAQPLMFGAIAILVVLAIAEWLVRRWLHRRKAET